MFLLELIFSTQSTKQTDSDSGVHLCLHNQLPLMIKGDSRLCDQCFHILQTGKSLCIKQSGEVITQEAFQQASCVLTPKLNLNMRLKIKDVLNNVHMSNQMRTYFEGFDSKMCLRKLSHDDLLILQVALLIENPCRVFIVQGDWTMIDEQALSYIKEQLKDRCKQGCYIIMSEGSACLFDEYEVWNIETKPPSSTAGFLEETISLSNFIAQTKKKHTIFSCLSKLLIVIYLLLSMILVVFISSFPHTYDDMKEEYEEVLTHYETADQHSLYLSASYQKFSNDNVLVPGYPYSTELTKKIKALCGDAFLAPIHRGHFVIGNDPDDIAIIKDGKRIALQTAIYHTQVDTTSYSTYTTFHMENAASMFMMDHVQDGVYLSKTMASYIKEDIANASIELELGIPVKWIESAYTSDVKIENDYRIYYQPLRVTLPIAGVAKQNQPLYGDLYIPDSIYQTLFEEALTVYNEAEPTDEYDENTFEYQNYVGENDTILPYTPAIYVMSVSDQERLNTIKETIQNDKTMVIAILDPYVYAKENLSSVDQIKDGMYHVFFPIVRNMIILDGCILLVAMILQHASNKRSFFQTNSNRKRSLAWYTLLEICGAMSILGVLSTAWVRDSFNLFANSIMLQNTPYSEWIQYLWYLDAWLQGDLWKLIPALCILVGCVVVAILPSCCSYLIQVLYDRLIRKERKHVLLSKM